MPKTIASLTTAMDRLDGSVAAMGLRTDPPRLFALYPADPPPPELERPRQAGSAPDTLLELTFVTPAGQSDTVLPDVGIVTMPPEAGAAEPAAAEAAPVELF